MLVGLEHGLRREDRKEGQGEERTERLGNLSQKVYLSALILHTCSSYLLASFPGSGAWVDEKKKAWYTQFAHAQFPQDFWEFENFHKCLLCYTNLCEACWLFLGERCLYATDYALCGRWRGSDEGNHLFTCRNYLCASPFQLNHMARNWCPLKFTNWRNGGSYCQSDIVSDFKSTQRTFSR